MLSDNPDTMIKTQIKSEIRDKNKNVDFSIVDVDSEFSG